MKRFYEDFEDDMISKFHDSDKSEKLEILGRSDCPDTVMLEAARSGDIDLLQKVATHKNAPEWVLLRVVQEASDERIKRDVINNKNSKDDVFEQILKDRNTTSNLFRYALDNASGRISGRTYELVCRSFRNRFLAHEGGLQEYIMPLGKHLYNIRYKNPNEMEKGVSVYRREIMSLFRKAKKEDISFEDIVGVLGNKQDAENIVSGGFGKTKLERMKQKKEKLSRADVEAGFYDSGIDVRVSDIEERWGEQTVKGENDWAIFISAANMPDSLIEFMRGFTANQFLSGHPQGFAFALFTLFGKGKKAVVTQIQSDIMSILSSEEKQDMLSRAGVPNYRRVIEDLKEFFGSIEKTWPKLVWRNVYRKLRKSGIDEIYLTTEDGLRQIGANPPISLVNSVISKKFAKREKLGQPTKIDVDGTEFPAYGKMENDDDVDMIEKLERVRDMPVNSVFEALQKLLHTNRPDKVLSPEIMCGGRQIIDITNGGINTKTPEGNPQDVEGFDTIPRDESQLFHNAVIATEGGFRFSEAYEDNLYFASSLSFGRKAKKNKVIFKKDVPVLYNSMDEAIEDLKKYCKKTGCSGGCVVSVKSDGKLFDKGLLRIVGMRYFPVTGL